MSEDKREFSINTIVISISIFVFLIVPFLVNIKLFESSKFQYFLAIGLILFCENHILNYILKQDMNIKYFGNMEYSKKVKNRITRLVSLIFYIFVLLLMFIFFIQYESKYLEINDIEKTFF